MPMGRHSEETKPKLRKGLWSPEEDEKLFNYISRFGVGCWSSVAKLAGLERCGKSCRLRWMNYLRPDLKRGLFSPQEEDLIIRLHEALGNRWAQIAVQLPGRTDNEIKNFWNSYLKKRLIKEGTDPITHKAISEKEEKEWKNSAEKSPLGLPQLNVDCTEVSPIWPCPARISKLRKNDVVPTTISMDQQKFHVTNPNYYEGGGTDGSIEKLGIKPNFDPLVLYEFQGSSDPIGYNSNLLPHYDHQTHFEGDPNFAFTPGPVLTDFSDNSSSRISSFSFNEMKESSSNSSNASIVENNGTFSCGEELVYGFQYSGMKCEEMKPSTIWPEGQIGQNTESFSSYPLMSLSESMDFSSKYYM